MHMDVLNQIAAAGTLVGSTGTNQIGDVIDLDPNDSGNIPNIGAGEPMWAVVVITTQVDSSGDGASANIQIVSDAEADLSDTPTVHLQTGVLAEAALTADLRVLAARLPSGTYEKYLGAQAVVSGEAITAGACHVFLTHDINDWQSIADGLAAGA